MNNRIRYKKLKLAPNRKSIHPRVHTFSKSGVASNLKTKIGMMPKNFLLEKQLKKGQNKNAHFTHETIDSNTTDEVTENETIMTNLPIDICYKGKILSHKETIYQTTASSSRKQKEHYDSFLTQSDKLWNLHKNYNHGEVTVKRKIGKCKDNYKPKQNITQASPQKGMLAFSLSKRREEGAKSILKKWKTLMGEMFSKGGNFSAIWRKLLLYMLVVILLVSSPIFLILSIFYNSPFAIFLPSVDSDKTIFTVTTAYTSDFNQEINALVENPSPADTAKIIYNNYEGDALAPSNYYDIIAVYMVQYGIGNMATIMDETAERNLKKVFDDMCSYTIKKKTEKPEEGSEHPQEQILIYVTLKDYRDMIKKYEFTQEQIELVETIMSPQYLALLGRITEDTDSSNSGSSQMQDLINNITDMEIKTVLNFALSKLGYPYSQQYRDSGKYYDCSSLTYYAWRSVGVDLLYEGSNTAAQQAKLCNDKGYTVSYSNIQPGDLIFYSFGHNGRYKNISHVAMYVGDGMLVDASYSKQKVVFRNVYSRENIVLIGRPRGK